MGKSEILDQLRKEFTFIGSEEITGKAALRLIEEVFDIFSQSPVSEESLTTEFHSNTLNKPNEDNF